MDVGMFILESLYEVAGRKG